MATVKQDVTRTLTLLAAFALVVGAAGVLIGLNSLRTATIYCRQPIYTNGPMDSTVIQCQGGPKVVVPKEGR